MREYETISGDTWDIVAWKIYGNELYADRLMEANADYLDYMIFPANIKLKIPDEETFRTREQADEFDWRSALNG